jgi:hypothetical protein
VVIASFFLVCGVPTPGSATGPERKKTGDGVTPFAGVSLIEQSHSGGLTPQQLGALLFGRRCPHFNHSQQVARHDQQFSRFFRVIKLNIAMATGIFEHSDCSCH